ncbi:Ectoine hydroxylase-related dioxygenase, phytanoyl-CoA dioxygenase (PhyH) family [Marininema mesophilum]|uniref:Ectoine hydroxylase-related dioxygenase, phytanoyl-CoA dioxygenase (PhyH) family n=1 Tax=Marininema mesophilum TaxID=1048340 RepID=A0A1H2VF45_9BACL|nr:phytanoyl-CoA dioxygenase family protein [Marininema mesophilum]SDW66932.1 Ectoine hydroxylase-related dioxygenase, phytanoyl-CoA dioxygenase (PhyH) family [Marininema mesophilum]
MGKNNILEAELKLNDRSNGQPLRVLTEEQFAFWLEYGYVVIKNAVNKEDLERLTKLIWNFAEKDPNDPTTWYLSPSPEMKMKELNGTGMVELYNHQLMWNNRTSEKIYNAFVDIWGTEKLWTSIDRVNLNLPKKDGQGSDGFIHWDVDTSKDPLPVNVQGVLSLVDASEDMGGFQCVPELFRDFPEWAKSQPKDRDPYHPDLTGYTPTKVVAEAGDLLIFNSMQPHGIRANHSNKARLAQYVSMFPAQEDNTELRNTRVTSWHDKVSPVGDAFPGDPREWEKKHHERAILTELGEKLLGLKSWE